MGAIYLVRHGQASFGTDDYDRLTETGFREMGWEAARLEEQYRDHSTGWDTFVPRLGEYVTRLVSIR